MKIITLTSDMGHRDHYVAAVKGYIYKRCEQVNVIDISNDVKAFNILQAAYFINNCFNDFPDGTIHIIAVNSEPVINFGQPDQGEFPCIVQFQNQYFVSIDNGIFSLILKDKAAQAIYRVEDMLSSPAALRFPTKNILAKIACELANGADPAELGEKVISIRKALAFNPVLEENIIKGTVIHIDHYGNIISNISEELFKKVGKDTPFTIYFRKKEYYIDIISTTYNEVPEGEKVALFNSNGNLEIAINKGVEGNGGGANALFGMKTGDIIRIEFHPRGSKATIDNLFT